MAPRPHRVCQQRTIAAGSAAALITLSGLLIFPGLHLAKRPSPGSSPEASSVSLHVERSAGDLLLTWGRDSGAIRAATHAVLSITDGERHEDVDLDLALLRNGSIVYSPSSSDIVFQLTVTGKNSAQTQSKSVRVFELEQTQSDSVPRSSPMLDSPSPSPSKPVPARTSGARGQPGAPSVAVEAVGQARSAEVPLRPFQQTSDLPDAPSLNPGGPQIQLVPPPGNPAATVPPPAPAPPPPAPPQTTTPPAPQPKVGGQVRAAQILTKTAPEYPLAARQARVQGSVVISAVVGADGHINSATTISGPPLLQNPAIAAVRQWVYKPATFNGIPIESETRIVLNFTLQH